MHDRVLGCTDPNRCCRTAQAIIEKLKPKWKPSARENIDGLSLTPGRKLRNKDARTHNQEVTFDPAIAREGDLHSYFRIFTQPTAVCHNPALRPMQIANMIQNQTTAYVAGMRTIDDLGNISAGSGIWYNHADGRNTSLRYPTDINSDHLSELLAVLWVINDEPPHNNLTIKTTSRYVIKAILDHVKTWEQTGYIGVANREVLRAVIASLRSRGGPTNFVQLTDATVEFGCSEAKNLAKIGANKELYDEPQIEINLNFNLTGAQLESMTQALAYKGICESKTPRNRRRTAQMLAITRHAVQDTTGNYPDDSAVWKSTRHRDFSKTYRSFIWKSMHSTHKIGTYWLQIPEFEQRERCAKCEATESLEHIILQCDIPGQRIVWKNAKQLWLKKHKSWPELRNIGHVTGCGLAEFKNQEGKALKDVNRLYRILISESAHFIWKLRCKRVSEGKPEEEWPQETEIHNRWLATMNARLTLDRAITNNKYGKRALRQEVVLGTWRNVLENEKNLPKNWLRTTGVLVGIGQMVHQDGIPDIPDEPP